MTLLVAFLKLYQAILLVRIGDDFAQLALLIQRVAQNGQFFFTPVKLDPTLVESLALLLQQRLLLSRVLLLGLSLGANLVLLPLALLVEVASLGG